MSKTVRVEAIDDEAVRIFINDKFLFGIYRSELDTFIHKLEIAGDPIDVWYEDPINDPDTVSIRMCPGTNATIPSDVVSDLIRKLKSA